MRKRALISLVVMIVLFSAGTVWGYTEGESNYFGTLSGDTGLGVWNTFYGGYTGRINEGNNNSFFGVQTGYGNVDGNDNSYFGTSSGFYNLHGSNNSFFGVQAGMQTTGSGNVFLGYHAGYNELGSNKLYISNSDTSTPLIYGEFDNQYLEINGTMVASSVTLSDARFKKNVIPLESSLERVKSLQGVTYTWKTDEYSGKGFPEGRHIGLIAQDVEKIFPELIYTDRNGYKAVAYDKLVPVLIEAIKEQQSTIHELKMLLQEQQAMIGQLQTALQFKQDKDTNLVQAN